MAGGEEAFIQAAIREGYLTSSDVEELKAARTHAEQVLGRSVPLEHLLAQQEWLTAQQLACVSALVKRRILLCPSCWSRINGFGLAPLAYVTCGRCDHRLQIPNEPDSEILLPLGDSFGDFPTVTPILFDAPPQEAEGRGEPAPTAPSPPAMPTPIPRLSETDTALQSQVVPPPTPPDRSPATPSGDALRQGFRLRGYSIIDLAGAGAMGVVYRAIQRPSQRSVALKLMQPQFRQEKCLVRRFFREASVAGKIVHPNVVPVLHAGCIGGTYFLVMPFVEGKSLQARIEEVRRLEPTEALRIGFEVALGLAAIHRAGAVHRDIKPSNILIRRDRTACITDFGLVRGTEAQFTALTGSNSTVGTPQFMAPEQALDARTATAASDQYSLGATLFYALTGTPPFAGRSTAHIFVELKYGRTPRLPEDALHISPSVRKVVERLMAGDPGSRFPDLEAAGAAIADSLKLSHAGGRTCADTDEPEERKT